MKTLRARLQHIAVLSLLVVVATGCQRQAESHAPTTTKTFAMNVVVSGVPFWADTKSTWEAIQTGREDIQTLFGGPLDTDSQKQIEQIEALLAKGVDGLIVAPTDSAALVPVIDRAVAQGVPVITYLVDAPRSQRLTYITSELEGASVRAAREVFKPAAGTQQAVVVFAQEGNAEQEARRRGFEQFAHNAESLSIVQTVTDKYDENAGAEKLKAVLTAHPDIKYIFGCNSRSAVGAVTALKELGRAKGSVVVTGWDADKDVLELIRDGWVAASVVQQSSFMTQQAFAILDAKRGGWLYPKNRSLEEHGVRPVPEEIVVPVQLITPQSVQAYYPR